MSDRIVDANWCECEGNHQGNLYFLSMSDSNSASNGVFVCRTHLLTTLDLMLPDTASVDVQLANEAEVKHE